MALLQISELCYQPKHPWYALGKSEPFHLGPISFDLDKGETISIIGENSCGKSLLAKLITGVVQPTAGQILLNGHDIANTHASERAGNIRMVFRHSAHTLNPGLSVGQMLAEPLLLNTQMSAQARHEKIMKTLKLVGLMGDHFFFYKHMLSDGQQQRVALARALILDPQVIVADEPFAALDPSVRSQTVNLLLSLQQELGLAFIFISHNLGIVRHMSDRTIVLHEGKIAEMNLTQTLFLDPKHDASKQLIYAHNALLTL
ncbi:MAG: ATP-binding cassette domain-containing protein [Glaciecola sp.]|jgi:cationic peptide transport system ATP-binding protein